MVSGFAAAASFLAFTGLGYLAQVIRLVRRKEAKASGALGDQQVTEGLHPVREMWSYLAFLFFALSGITRSYVDFVLLLSRFPVVVLSAVILWFLASEEIPKARTFFIISLIGTAFLLLLSAAAAVGHRVTNPYLVQGVDAVLSCISVFLFYGKSTQAWTMYRDRKARGVSWLREIGVLLKDLFGLWYAVGVGYELRWVTFTHILSAIAGVLICTSKYLVEKKLKIQESSTK